MCGHREVDWVYGELTIQPEQEREGISRASSQSSHLFTQLGF